jgi:hypothetical protein
MNVDGGAERDRTADLVIANDALSQLSYSPASTCMDVPTGRGPVESGPENGSKALRSQGKLNPYESIEIPLTCTGPGR